MNLWQDLNQITKLLRNSHIKVLMMDFDGTLAPIVKSPDRAKLPKEVKNLLISLCKKAGFYLVVISGRNLEDLKEKISLQDIIYAGNHGLEGKILGKVYSFPVSDKALTVLKSIHEKLDNIADQFKGVFIEDKKMTLGFHYRMAKEQQIPAIKLLFVKTLEPFIKNRSVSVITGKMVFDILPKANWNKGSFAKLVIDKIRAKTKKTPAAIFIGDDTTDEDVFQKVEKGVTIRVGRERQSSAHYRLGNITEVRKFLKWLNAKF
ncbi:trehalose-phosphatase [Candidatus Daviesbacteria bacterium]|nr:trehalose-phosphatase [Candidatus Daviesbacteria bacterium]